jgi:signal transduction histidine kinase
MELQDHTAFLAQLLPTVATQLRPALSSLHFAAAALAPAEARERDPELDAKAAVLDQSYYQLLRLVNNLTYAGYVKGDEPLTVSDLDLVDLLANLCDRYRSLAQLLGLGFSFKCELSSHICAVNRESIEQLLAQLLSNAFKFTPKGGNITVELWTAGGRVLLSVADNGCGIAEAMLPTLFDRYLHEDLMDPPPHGLGLGLPICRKIAERHGGSIMAESKEGTGTCITLSIPDRQTGTAFVSDVPFDYAGGFNHTLLALSDALPVKAFQLRDQD